MKQEHISMARDAIAGRASGRGAQYYRSGDPDIDSGFREVVNTEYIIRSLDPHCGWEAALNENKQLFERIQMLEKEQLRLQDEIDASRLQVAGLEERKNELIKELRNMLASAYPHPTEHPTMTAAWISARRLIGDSE